MAPFRRCLWRFRGFRGFGSLRNLVLILNHRDIWNVTSARHARYFLWKYPQIRHRAINTTIWANETGILGRFWGIRCLWRFGCSWGIRCTWWYGSAWCLRCEWSDGAFRGPGCLGRFLGDRSFRCLCGFWWWWSVWHRGVDVRRESLDHIYNFRQLIAECSLAIFHIWSVTYSFPFKSKVHKV